MGTQSDWQPLLPRALCVPQTPLSSGLSGLFQPLPRPLGSSPIKSPCPSPVTFMLLSSVLYLEGFTPSHHVHTQGGFMGSLTSHFEMLDRSVADAGPQKVALRSWLQGGAPCCVPSFIACFCEQPMGFFSCCFVFIVL